MGSVAAVLVFVIASALLAVRMSPPQNRRSSLLVVFVAWTVLFPFLLITNEWIPFSGGGDDEAYFHLADYFSEWSDLSSLSVLSTRLAQPGYAVVLNVLNIVFSPGIAGFKALNLFCFIALVFVWARSVEILGGARLSRNFAVACLFLTPLWFYFFFLLKDVLIALLMAIFLLGLIKVWLTPRSLAGWALQLVAVIGFIPLRTPLVTQAAMILIIVFMARIVGRGSIRHKAAMFFMGMIAIAAILWLASSSGIIEAFGVESRSRVLGTSEMIDRGARVSEDSSINRALFPLLYILSETSGLSISAWREFDGPWLRGLLALPWIFFVVPLLPSGVLWLMRRTPRAQQSRGFVFRLSDRRAMSTPWVVIVAFIVTSIMISWVTGDTTRWRIADMPALLAVAMAGLQSMPRQRAFLVVLLWVLIFGSVFALGVLLRGG